jgi:uncharacterized protein YebE (UPF0316 family)
MAKFITLFFVVQLINVTLNTLRSCILTKGNKVATTLMSAVCYGFYTIVIVYTTSDFNLWIKVIIVTSTNLIGTYFSMWLLEKLRKDRLWEITATLTEEKNVNALKNELYQEKIAFNYTTVYEMNEHYVFHIYSPTQKESTIVKKLLKKYNARYIVHEETVKL